MENLNKIKVIIREVLRRNKIVRAGIFGSYARGEQKKNSDIDIVIEFNDSLLTLIGIEMELEKALRKRVDLLTYKGIHPLLKDRILSEEIKII